MPAARYRFHCTDGHDAVLDRAGRLVPGEHRLRAYAVQAARAVMDCDAGLDWSDWVVDVHDARGRRRLMLGFAEVATVHRAPGPRADLRFGRNKLQREIAAKICHDASGLSDV